MGKSCETNPARVAELADALGLGPSAERRAGSSPVPRSLHSRKLDTSSEIPPSREGGGGMRLRLLGFLCQYFFNKAFGYPTSQKSANGNVKETKREHHQKWCDKRGAIVKNATGDTYEHVDSHCKFGVWYPVEFFLFR